MNIIIYSLVAFLVFFLTSNTIANSQQVDNWLDDPNELEYEYSHSTLRNLGDLTESNKWVAAFPDETFLTKKRPFKRYVKGFENRLVTPSGLAAVMPGDATKGVEFHGTGSSQFFIAHFAYIHLDCDILTSAMVQLEKKATEKNIGELVCADRLPLGILSMCILPEEQYKPSIFIVQLYPTEPQTRDYLIYVKSPKRRSKVAFLGDLSTTVKTILDAVQLWNQKFSNSSIELIRIPLIGGGYNIKKLSTVTQRDVASTIMNSLYDWRNTDPMKVLNARFEFHLDDQQFLHLRDFYRDQDRASDSEAALRPVMPQGGAQGVGMQGVGTQGVGTQGVGTQGGLTDESSESD